MLASFKHVVLALLLGLSALTSAQCSVTPTPSTCRGTRTVLTTTSVRTYTSTYTTTAPYSCFAATISPPPPRCPDATPTRCTYVPDCIIVSTTTHPCKDKCCPFTPTAIVDSMCTTSCVSGCLTQWTTVTRSVGCTNAP